MSNEKHCLTFAHRLGFTSPTQTQGGIHTLTTQTGSLSSLADCERFSVELLARLDVLRIVALRLVDKVLVLNSDVDAQLHCFLFLSS